MYDRKSDKPWTRLTPRDKVSWLIFHSSILCFLILAEYCRIWCYMVSCGCLISCHIGDTGERSK